jgi:hypothetical protein
MIIGHCARDASIAVRDAAGSPKDPLSRSGTLQYPFVGFGSTHFTTPHPPTCFT